jgi:rare lipoprotein A
MKRQLFLPVFSVLIVLGFGCATTITGPGAPEGSVPSPKAAKVVETFEGTASWYGPEFHGKKTASGEVFDMRDLTAAHKDLPLGTTCIVTNLRNNKSVTVRINDRGPFVKDRVIDLSYAAAKVVGMIDTGTAPVRVEVLAGGDTTGTEPVAAPAVVETPIETEAIVPPPAETIASAPTGTGTVPPPTETGVVFTVQVGSFSSKANADTLLATISTSHTDAYIEEFSTTESTYWRVRVGKFTKREDAEHAAADLTAAGYSVFITPK